MLELSRFAGIDLLIGFILDFTVLYPDRFHMQGIEYFNLLIDFILDFTRTLPTVLYTNRFGTQRLRISSSVMRSVLARRWSNQTFKVDIFYKRDT